jgi:hypothetical protein
MAQAIEGAIRCSRTRCRSACSNDSDQEECNQSAVMFEIGRKHACILMEKSTRSRVVFLHIFIGDQIKLILLTKYQVFMSYDDRVIWT